MILFVNNDATVTKKHNDWATQKNELLVYQKQNPDNLVIPFVKTSMHIFYRNCLLNTQQEHVPVLYIMLWRSTIGVNSAYLFKRLVLCAHCKICISFPQNDWSNYTGLLTVFFSSAPAHLRSTLVKVKGSKWSLTLFTLV